MSECRFNSLHFNYKLFKLINIFLQLIYDKKLILIIYAFYFSMSVFSSRKAMTMNSWKLFKLYFIFVFSKNTSKCIFINK